MNNYLSELKCKGYKVEIVEHKDGYDNVWIDYLIIREDGVSQIYQWHEIHYCGQFAAALWDVVPGEPDVFNLSQEDIRNIVRHNLCDK